MTMERFSHIESVALSVAQANIDTDQIIPGRFLHKARREGLGQYLFHDTRALLNRPGYESARVLVAGPNFGCGSSRENAVWALYDYGFRAVIAPSFGDIFRNNCLKNGLLPVVLPPYVVTGLLASLEALPLAVRVDLESQAVILPGGAEVAFQIDPFARQCLLEGLDELDYTLTLMNEIESYERQPVWGGPPGPPPAPAPARASDQLPLDLGADPQ
jgi:3-isopropylmalate/(R)-2-methylmalate dehydratase small subunit